MTSLVIVLLLASPADFPANVGSREAAREDARMAEAEFNLGHHAKAASLYEQAYKLVADPILLYDMGQSFRLAGEPGKAIFAYRAYLRTSTETAPNRRHARELIGELEASLAASPDAFHEMALDPASVHPQPSLSLALKEPPAVLPATSSWEKWAAWTGTGATVALGVAAIVEGLSANASFNSLQSTCGKTKSCTAAQISGGKSKVLATNVLWGLTAVSAAATGVFFYLDLSGGKAAGLSLSWGY